MTLAARRLRVAKLKVQMIATEPVTKSGPAGRDDDDNQNGIRAADTRQTTSAIDQPCPRGAAAALTQQKRRRSPAVADNWMPDNWRAPERAAEEDFF
jgi:hypothetical protein